MPMIFQQKHKRKFQVKIAFIILDNIRKTNEVFKNSGVVICKISAMVFLILEFRSKMNTIGGDVLAGLNKAIDIS